MAGNNGKDGLLFNKIAAGVLGSLLTIMVVREVGNGLYQPEQLAEPAYKIEIADAGASAGAAQAEEVLDEAGIAALIAAADPGKGQKVAKKCISCHSFEKGGKVGTGPNLWGIMGAQKAAKSDFAGYSAAMIDMGGTWDLTSLFDFLENPKKFLKGTGMSFAGLRKTKDRAAILAYLNTMADAPMALPAAAAPALESPAPSQE